VVSLARSVQQSVGYRTDDTTHAHINFNNQTTICTCQKLRMQLAKAGESKGAATPLGGLIPAIWCEESKREAVAGAEPPVASARTLSSPTPCRPLPTLCALTTNRVQNCHCKKGAPAAARKKTGDGGKCVVSDNTVQPRAKLCFCNRAQPALGEGRRKGKPTHATPPQLIDRGL